MTANSWESGYIKIQINILSPFFIASKTLNFLIDPRVDLGQRRKKVKDSDDQVGVLQDGKRYRFLHMF